METLYKIQPTEIEQLMQEKLANRKIDDEFGWTGEWRMSAKNVLDLIIDLQNNKNLQNHNYIIDGCASLMMLLTGQKLNIYQRGDARQELDKLLSDNKNTLKQIEKLEADKKELLALMVTMKDSFDNKAWVTSMELQSFSKRIESLIQKT